MLHHSISDYTQPIKQFAMLCIQGCLKCLQITFHQANGNAFMIVSIKSTICRFCLCDLVGRRYDQSGRLASRSNGEISRLSIIVRGLKKEKLEAIEKYPYSLLDKVNSIDSEIHPHKLVRKKSSKYMHATCVLQDSQIQNIFRVIVRTFTMLLTTSRAFVSTLSIAR
jgi:hypothetical protein